jgi:hypothetical protein
MAEPTHQQAYEDSITGLMVLQHHFPFNQEATRALQDAISDLKFAQRQEASFKEASLDARRSLAQEIHQTLKTRGHWVPDDCMSSDLISAVGQAVPYDDHKECIHSLNMGM